MNTRENIGSKTQEEADEVIYKAGIKRGYECALEKVVEHLEFSIDEYKKILDAGESMGLEDEIKIGMLTLSMFKNNLLGTMMDLTKSIFDAEGILKETT